MLLKRKYIIAYSELTLSMIFLGSSIVMGKLLISVFPIYILLGIRFLLGTFIFYTAYRFKLKIKNEHLSLKKTSNKDILLLFLQAFFGAFLFNLFMLLGLQHTAASSAAIITSTLPAFIGLFSFLILKERISSKKLIAIAITMLSLSIINLSDEKTASMLVNFTGNFLIMLAVIAGALFPIFAKKASSHIRPIVISLLFNFFGLLLLLPFIVQSLLYFNYQLITFFNWVIVIFYSLAANVLYLIFWNRGLTVVSASTASLFTAVMPVSASFLAYFFLHEHLTLYSFISMLLIVIAIFIGVAEK